MIVVSCPNAPWLASSLADGLAALGLETEVHSLDMGPPRTPPRCAIVDLDDPNATKLLDRFLDESLATTETAPGFALIGVGRGNVEQRIEEAFTLGIDDFVHTDDLESLISRVSKLLFSFAETPPSTERAWILSSGDNEPGEAHNHLVRVLGQAGFCLRRAVSNRQTVEQLIAHKWNAWMVDGSQSPIRLKQELLKIRRHPRLNGLPIVVIHAAETARQLRSSGINGPIAAVSSSDSLSTLLYAIREVTRPAIGDPPRRFLHSAVARFRSLEGTNWHTGLTLDLSEDGIFVRSLLVPPKGEAIELRVQTDEGASESAKLIATVIRANPVPIVAGGLVPAGFGARLQMDSCDPAQAAIYRKMLLRLGARPDRVIPASITPASIKEVDEDAFDVTDAELEEVFSLPPDKQPGAGS